MASPRCALHATEVATGACGRCGDYGCSRCLAPEGGGTCPACRLKQEREAFPFDRQNVTLLGVAGHALKTLARDPLRLLGYEFACTMPPLIVYFATFFAYSEFSESLSPWAREAFDATQELLTDGVFAPLSLAISFVYVRSVLGRPFDLESAAGNWRRWIPFVGVIALNVLMTFPVDVILTYAGEMLASPTSTESEATLGMGSIELALLGVRLTYDMVVWSLVEMATVELVGDSEASLVDALKSVLATLRGHWLPFVFVSCVASFFIVTGLFLCVLPVVLTSLLAGLYMTTYYVALRTPSPESQPV